MLSGYFTYVSPVSRLWLLVSWGVCWLLCLLALWALWEAPQSGPVQAAIFVGGLATSGWLFTNYRTRKNQIEKNTYDLILVYVKDPFYVAHKKIVWNHFPPYQAIPATEIPDLVQKYYSKEGQSDHDSPATSLVQIINFYEYVAIGIKSGVLSEKLCKAYWRTTFKNFDSKKAGAFVNHVIKMDNAERKDSSKSVVFSNYLWLRRRWA